MKKKILGAFLCAFAAGPLFAGLSLVLTPGKTVSVGDPTQPVTQGWRIEFQLHNWIIPPSLNSPKAYVWAMSGLGISSELLYGDYLRVIDRRDSTDNYQCDLSLAGRTNVLVRIQRDPAAKLVSCELWNSDGSGYQSTSSKITAFLNWTFNGGTFGSADTTARLGFYRVFDSVIAPGGRPPTTAEIGNLANFTFDGNSSDTSGKGNNGQILGAGFATSPIQSPASIPRTAGAPAWSTWVSLRAGFPATLDGTASFSLADGSSAVHYRWQQISGPSKVRWSSMTTAMPVITGLVFGTYRLRLQVMDAAGRTATTDLNVGAVATDDNGVVVQANPAADIIFGPMIAFGKNPWPWQDQINLHAAELRQAYYRTLSPPGWSTDLPGRISFTPGDALQPAQTTLSSPFNASDMTLRLTDVSKLDFSSLPSIVMVHTPGIWSPVEEVRICSVSGNTLQVCYDGRAWRAGEFARYASGQSWPAGSTVRQVKTTGIGTTFLTDFCPAGIGEEGQVTYSTGTVKVTPGSATLSGSGVQWANTMTSLRLRIPGSHGGAPFIFTASIQSVTSGNTIQMSRAWPADADPATNLTYSVYSTGRGIARTWKRPDGSTGRQVTYVSSCESDTQMYMTEIFSNITGVQVDQTYGYDSSNWFSEFGPNYYDEVLANYAGYFRSGYDLFLNNARAIGDYLPTSPDFDEGWLGQFPRRVGATGMVAAAVLDGRTSNWYTLRKLATQAVTDPFNGAILPDCDGDLRESAYELSWLSFAALFDPQDTGDPNQPGQRSYWKRQLDAAYHRDTGCKGSASQFPVSTYGGSGAFNLTKGSDIVRGTNMDPSMCAVAATGTMTVTNGSVSATGSGFVANAKIVVIGKRLGQPYLFYSHFTVNSAASITLATVYDGDSGTYPYQIETDVAWLAFAKGQGDHVNADTLYVCRWLDPSTLKLDRPWAGDTGTFTAQRYVAFGYGEQPFMLGIKTFAMQIAGLAATGETATGYAELAKNTASWVLNEGFNPVTGGLFYARDWGGCEPITTPRLDCADDASPDGKEASRVLNGEAQNAMRVAYQANPTPQVKSFGDQFYGAQWGKLGGPYHDDVYLRALDNDVTFQYKWMGFLFGIGQSHQWPAVRIGGVQPAIPVTSSVSFDLSSIAGAASVKILVTAPSGAVSLFPCSSSPCQISLDARQGSHWFQIGFFNQAGELLRSSDPDLISAN